MCGYIQDASYAHTVVIVVVNGAEAAGGATAAARGNVLVHLGQVILVIHVEKAGEVQLVRALQGERRIVRRAKGQLERAVLEPPLVQPAHDVLLLAARDADREHARLRARPLDDERRLLHDEPPFDHERQRLAGR